MFCINGKSVPVLFKFFRQLKKQSGSAHQTKVYFSSAGSRLFQRLRMLFYRRGNGRDFESASLCINGKSVPVLFKFFRQLKKQFLAFIFPFKERFEQDLPLRQIRRIFSCIAGSGSLWLMICSVLPMNKIPPFARDF